MPSPSDFWPSESIDEGEQQEDLLAKMMRNKAKREQEELQAQGQPPEIAGDDNQEGEW
jgi:hypothetical protein